MILRPEDILDFWYREVGEERWFDADPALDALVRDRFLDLHEQAARGDLAKWEETPIDMLALLLLLNQFPHRMFRGTARAYATDRMALGLARTAIVKHFDDRIAPEYKLVFYLPFEHSENKGDQRLALFYIRERTKNSLWLAQAERNADLIERFGRFPCRNQLLGRLSTPEEEEFLKLEQA